MTAADAKAAQEQLDSIPGLAKFNMEVLELSQNQIRLRLPIEGNTQHLGTMYAGALYSLAEFPFGLLYLWHFQGKAMVPILGEMSIRYLQPVTTDATVTLDVTDQEWAEMEAGTLANGKHKFVRELEIHDGEGKPVARTSATYFSLATG